MHSPTLEELSSMVEDVMHLGRQSCYNCITWNVSCTTKIFPCDNEKINVTTKLVIIFFRSEVYGKCGESSSLLWRKVERKMQSRNYPCKFSPGMLFSLSFLQKAKGLFCWRTITGTVRTLNLKAVRRPRYGCDGPLAAHFLCVLSTFCSLSAEHQPNCSCFVAAAGSKALSLKRFQKAMKV